MREDRRAAGRSSPAGHRKSSGSVALRDHARTSETALVAAGPLPDCRAFARRWRSAAACFWRASGLARCLRCRWAACRRRFALRQRSSSRWQSGCRQNWSWGRRAWNFRPHPLRKHLRQPSRFPLVEPPLSVVRCACPLGGLAPLGQPGEESRPPRALLNQPAIPVSSSGERSRSFRRAPKERNEGEAGTLYSYQDERWKRRKPEGRQLRYARP